MSLQRFYYNYKCVYGYIKSHLFRPTEWRFNCMYNRLNKLYQKENLDKDCMTELEAYRLLTNKKLQVFHSLSWLLKHKCLRCVLEHKSRSKPTKYYSTKDIKMELLKKEMACWKDYALYRKELYCKRRHLKMMSKNKAAQYQRIILVINGKEYTLGKYNSKFVPKLKRIIKILYENRKIFDPENENYISPNMLTCIGRKINTKNVDTFDPIEELKKLR